MSKNSCWDFWIYHQYKQFQMRNCVGLFGFRLLTDYFVHWCECLFSSTVWMNQFDKRNASKEKSCSNDDWKNAILIISQSRAKKKEDKSGIVENVSMTRLWENKNKPRNKHTKIRCIFQMKLCVCWLYGR